MVNGWVTVTVDGVVFTTIADKYGDYSLEVYSDSSDNLLKADNLSASAWAAELFGRKHSRLMLAAVSDR